MTVDAVVAARVRLSSPRHKLFIPRPAPARPFLADIADGLRTRSGGPSRPTAGTTWGFLIGRRAPQILEVVHTIARAARWTYGTGCRRPASTGPATGSPTRAVASGPVGRSPASPPPSSTPPRTPHRLLARHQAPLTRYTQVLDQIGGSHRGFGVRAGDGARDDARDVDEHVGRALDPVARAQRRGPGRAPRRPGRVARLRRPRPRRGAPRTRPARPSSAGRGADGQRPPAGSPRRRAAAERQAVGSAHPMTRASNPAAVRGRR